MGDTLGLRFGHARDLEHKQRAQATIFREGQERIRSGSKGYRSAATMVALITMRAKIWKAVQKLYAVGILVYFAAAGIGGVSISDFSDWASFMGRHAVYAFAWPVAAGAEIDS